VKRRDVVEVSRGKPIGVVVAVVVAAVVVGAGGRASFAMIAWSAVSRFFFGCYRMWPIDHSCAGGSHWQLWSPRRCLKMHAGKGV
jgi:hypothetical protein